MQKVGEKYTILLGNSIFRLTSEIAEQNRDLTHKVAQVGG